MDRGVRVPPGVWVEFENLAGHLLVVDLVGLYSIEQLDEGTTLLGFVIPGTHQTEHLTVRGAFETVRDRLYDLGRVRPAKPEEQRGEHPRDGSAPASDAGVGAEPDSGKSLGPLAPTEHGRAHSTEAQERPAQAGREEDPNEAPTNSDEASQDPDLSPESGPAAQAATNPRVTEAGACGEVAGATREGEGDRKVPLPNAPQRAATAERRRAVAELVRAARHRRRISQRELGNEIGVSKVTVAFLETERTCSVDNLERAEAWAIAPHARDHAPEPEPLPVASRDERKRVGELVRAARERAGLSQGALAALLGATQALVSTVERGITASVETLAKFEAWARTAPTKPPAAAPPPPATTRSPAPTPPKPVAVAPPAPSIADPTPAKAPAAAERVPWSAPPRAVRKQPMRKSKPSPWERQRAPAPATPRVLPSGMEQYDCPPMRARVTRKGCQDLKRSGRDECKGCPGVVALAKKRPSAA